MHACMKDGSDFCRR